MTSIVWFRDDLRLSDHPALCAAAGEGEVLAVFVRDPATRPGPVKQRRIDASLVALQEATRGALVVRSGASAGVLAGLAAEVGARRVHATAATTPQGRQLDARVAEQLEGHRIELTLGGTAYAVAPGTLRTSAGQGYRVFSAFARAWREQMLELPLPDARVRWRHGVRGEDLTAAERLRGGEEIARARWQSFLDDDLSRYADERDRPDLDTTSRISVHLALGELHPRTLLADLASHPGGGFEGGRKFVDELCWREFFADVLWHQPESAWSDGASGAGEVTAFDPAGPELDAWQHGRTGYPLVDAGMRQLLAEGWMHNRVRMLVASFLVKDLHLPWQVGARHFMAHLADADLASNNGNWQWVAGTGVDAAPFFRVFNPVRQGLRFDPAGDYVRHWVPELAHLAGSTAHQPWLHADGYAHGYPHRIVDHDEERRVALARHGRGRQSASL